MLTSNGPEITDPSTWVVRKHRLRHRVESLMMGEFFTYVRSIKGIDKQEDIEETIRDRVRGVDYQE